MGRKGAPEPLSLPDDSGSDHPNLRDLPSAGPMRLGIPKPRFMLIRPLNHRPRPQASSWASPVHHTLSTTASRFWGFGKSNKSNQFRHIHTNSSSEFMSRGPDYPNIAEKGPSRRYKTSETDLSSVDPSNHKATVPLPSRSDVSLTSTVDRDNSNGSRKNKQKPFALLGRNRSLKEQEDNNAKGLPVTKDSESEQSNSQPLKTAPVYLEGPERSFKHMMNSAPRNHSADRALPRDVPGNKDNRGDKDQNRSHPSSYRDNGGSNFFTGLKTSGSWAFDMGKQFFAKGGRSGSSSHYNQSTNSRGDNGIDDEHYVLKVISLPLVEQTRLTRISKRLEDSRDKTEFWMPAFPWRAIDYLNYKGTEVEGLYRVPGSGPQIKKWQRKFDEEEGDVDLFAQDDLYDINIVGSMLKAWLRELPDELFPKSAQERIARECAGTEEVPQLLIDELSNLSPFNYYLLFAITCHLSLLLAHADKNKMDFRNLCICFQPCMKIDAFCFKFLERDERNISSSDSSKQSTLAQDLPQNGKLRKKPLASGPSNGSMESNSTAATSVTGNSNREMPRRYSQELRPLSPIKPLSPLGF
ncbi:hypothetical protein SLS62_008888 [Diatrype stigma]|uniref:Rho-GAP domain-containing protein n=1 Tax=Diatrype stigma TaxID=117547 RepID=A0AAN9UG82_9PEZI